MNCEIQCRNENALARQRGVGCRSIGVPSRLGASGAATAHLRGNNRRSLATTGLDFCGRIRASSHAHRVLPLFFNRTISFLRATRAVSLARTKLGSPERPWAGWFLVGKIRMVWVARPSRSASIGHFNKHRPVRRGAYPQPFALAARWQPERSRHSKKSRLSR